MSFIEESKVFINDKVTAAFQSCKADPESVRQATAGKSLGHWRKLCITQGIGCAGGALLPGPAALAALAIEIPLLLNVFSRAALGVGWIKCGRVLPGDYENILALWAGEVSLDDSLRKTVQAQAAMAVAATAPKLMASMSAATLTTALTIVAAKNGTSAAASYLAARKFAAMIVSKLPARLIPLVGLGVAATLNAWFVKNILDTAEQYYTFLDNDLLAR